MKAWFVLFLSTTMFAALLNAENTKDKEPGGEEAKPSEVASVPKVIDVNIPPDLEIEVDFVMFEKKQIEVLSRNKPLNSETLLSLYAAGSGELLAAPVVRASPGREATIKGVVDYIYPTNFDMSTNDVAPNSVVETTVMPQDFATREVGVILNVLPELGPDGRTVALTLKPEMVFPPTWRDYGTSLSSSTNVLRCVRMDQPFFPVAQCESSITTVLDSKVLLGGGVPSSDGTKIIYLFACVRKCPVK